MPSITSHPSIWVHASQYNQHLSFFTFTITTTHHVAPPYTSTTSSSSRPAHTMIPPTCHTPSRLATSPSARHHTQYFLARFHVISLSHVISHTSVMYRSTFFTSGFTYCGRHYHSTSGYVATCWHSPHHIFADCMTCYLCCFSFVHCPLIHLSTSLYSCLSQRAI